MAPEDYFKFLASNPRLSMLQQGIEELLEVGADDEDIRELVRSLTQRVLWTTIESTDRGLEVAFGTKDDKGGRYSYSVVAREPNSVRRSTQAVRSVRP